MLVISKNRMSKWYYHELFTEIDFVPDRLNIFSIHEPKSTKFLEEGSFLYNFKEIICDSNISKVPINV